MTITTPKKSKLMTAEQRASHALSQLGRLQAKVEDNERKRANKVRFLLGSGLETMMRKDPLLRARIEAFMTGFLTRKADRTVFDLDADQNYFARLAAGVAEEEVGLSVLVDPNKASAPDREPKHEKSARPSAASASAPPAASGNGTVSASRPQLAQASSSATSA